EPRRRRNPFAGGTRRIAFADEADPPSLSHFAAAVSFQPASAVDARSVVGRRPCRGRACAPAFGFPDFLLATGGCFAGCVPRRSFGFSLPRTAHGRTHGQERGDRDWPNARPARRL